MDLQSETSAEVPYTLYLMESYLRKNIVELELKQIAESVKSIVDVTVDEQKGLHETYLI